MGGAATCFLETGVGVAAGSPGRRAEIWDKSQWSRKEVVRFIKSDLTWGSLNTRFILNLLMGAANKSIPFLSLYCSTKNNINIKKFGLDIRNHRC